MGTHAANSGDLLGSALASKIDNACTAAGTGRAAVSFSVTQHTVKATASGESLVLALSFMLQWDFKWQGYFALYCTGWYSA